MARSSSPCSSSNSKPYWKPEQPPPWMYTRSFSAGLPSSAISSLTLAAAAAVKSIGRFGGGAVSGRPTISMCSGWRCRGRRSSARGGTPRRVGPRERLLHRVAARRREADGDPHRGETLRQHHVALDLLEVLERVLHRRRLFLLAQVGPLQLLQAAVAGAFDRERHPAFAGLAAVQVLGQGGGEVPHLALAGTQLQFVHGQA